MSVAVATGWPPSEVEALDAQGLATVVQLIAERAG